MGQEAGNWPNIDWQEKIHRGILRGVRNISETPYNKGMKKGLNGVLIASSRSAERLLVEELLNVYSSGGEKYPLFNIPTRWKRVVLEACGLGSNHTLSRIRP